MSFFDVAPMFAADYYKVGHAIKMQPKSASMVYSTWTARSYKHHPNCPKTVVFGHQYTIQKLLEFWQTEFFDQSVELLEQEWNHVIKNTFHPDYAGFTPAKEPFPANEDLLWDREHIYDTTEGEGICVHGHTPISEYLILRLDNANNFLPPDRQFSYSYNGGALWYCDNHKVDIDCCSYMSGKTVLLNLDTFDEHIFTVDKEDE